MCESVERYAEKYAEKKAEMARLDNLLDSIKKLMDKLAIGADQAMNLLDVSDIDRAVLLKKL